jgi:hypothetical protein
MTQEIYFNGPDYVPELDRERLARQLERIKSLMLDGAWRTLSEVSSTTRDPESSVSAQLRHLRKKRFGSYTVEKRRRGDRQRGLYEYRVLEPTDREKENLGQKGLIDKRVPETSVKLDDVLEILRRQIDPDYYGPNDPTRRMIERITHEVEKLGENS